MPPHVKEVADAITIAHGHVKNVTIVASILRWLVLSPEPGAHLTVLERGPRLASQGFVVLTIDTNTVYDQPDSRADQLQAALDYLTGRPDVDPARIGALGLSLGGAVTIMAAARDPRIKVAGALAVFRGVYILAGGEVTTLKVLIDRIAKIAGVEPPSSAVARSRAASQSPPSSRATIFSCCAT